MILADTSVWIQHFRKTEPTFVDLLNHGQVMIHPAIRGELAGGTLTARVNTLRYLSALPAAKAASDTEVLHLIEDRKLWGLGIGWVDAHLLAASLLSACIFWTFDERLKKAAAAARVKQL